MGITIFMHFFGPSGLYDYATLMWWIRNSPFTTCGMTPKRGLDDMC